MAHARITSQITGLRTFIRTNLGTELALVGTESGVTIPVPLSADHYIGRRDPFKLDRVPAVFYVATSLNPEPAGEYGGIETAQMFPLRVETVFVFKHAKPEQLELCLLGCADAVANIFAADPSVGGVCDSSEIEYLDWEHGDQDLGAVIASLVMEMEART